ncbi:hypothetical protein [Pseudovibrio sp. POLY-S9]|uniref:hypothetical protein n=1 Tax=Pseudovibrio sp. POLY-S9 TaxID=1576596 RepID=UPI000AC6CA04|nr:hypothetical protein [Pseudovibrio sp. POLY-S9]
MTDQSELIERYKKYSLNTLKELHDNARDAYKHDRSITDEHKRLAEAWVPGYNYSGVDEHSDWPVHVLAMEEALRHHGVSFQSIDLERESS